MNDLIEQATLLMLAERQLRAEQPASDEDEDTPLFI